MSIVSLCLTLAHTDLSVASSVQKLVAAVTLETQFVPVFPQRRHLFSCKTKDKGTEEWR